MGIEDYVSWGSIQDTAAYSGVTESYTRKDAVSGLLEVVTLSF